MKYSIFRGKRKDNGEWVYGYFVDILGMPRILHTSGKKPCTYEIEQDEVILETVGENIGKTDKNSKQIFEGDIVKVKFFNTNIGIEEKTEGIIVWDQESACYEIHIVQYCLHLSLKNQTEIEVVGNIHDNKAIGK